LCGVPRVTPLFRFHLAISQALFHSKDLSERNLTIPLFLWTTYRADIAQWLSGKAGLLDVTVTNVVGVTAEALAKQLGRQELYASVVRPVATA
jgi:hypothetical protein